MTQEELILKYAELKKENEQLKTENKLLREKIFDELHVDHEMIEAEYKRLKNCLEIIKDTCSVSPSVIFPSDILDTINEYLGE